MTTKNMIITATMLITGSIPAAPASVVLPSSIAVAELAKETLAKTTLKQVQVSAATVADQADHLRLMASLTASPESHLVELVALKDEVNRMGQEIKMLKVAGDSLAPFEQQALENILPLFRAVAANTESAIDYFNEHQEHLWTEANREYADRVSQDSEQIAKILKNCLKYDKLLMQEKQIGEHIRANSGA